MTEYTIGVPRWFALVLLLGQAQGHEIPNDVTILGFVKPSGQHLEILIRVPLKAMRDIEFPQRGKGYIDVARSTSLLHDAASVWVADQLTAYENDAQLPKLEPHQIRLSLESDKSFVSYEQALARFEQAQTELDVVPFQTLLDIQFEVPIRSEHSRFSLHSGLARLGVRTETVFRSVLSDGSVRVFEFSGDPGLIHLDPSWFQAAARFVNSGFFHILSGIDHLLFLLCLIIPFRRFRALVPVVTAFTVAHSITLIASAYDLAPSALWFPPLIETLIAASIVYMALENIVGTLHSRWIIAFAFGLVHGFGFSFALRETLQFAGAHLLTSLLAFNIGVELGQLLVLAILIPVLDLLFRFVAEERIGTIILSALVAHTGWHWMIDRGSQLSQYRFEWPTFNAAFFASGLRWGMLLTLAAGLAWLVSLRFRRAAGELKEDQQKLRSR